MRKLIALLLLLIAMPAHAERLQFDHRLSPPLQKVLDEGRSEMVQFDGSDPTRLVDLIAVRGELAMKWQEALQIVLIPKQKKIDGAQGWMAQIESGIRSRSAAAACKAEFAVLAQDENSVTFERRSPGCGGIDQLRALPAGHGQAVLVPARGVGQGRNFARSEGAMAGASRIRSP